MNYQLVLQWSGSSLAGYDEMIGVELELANKLPTEHEVDGHDCGADESNIFIHTNEPLAALSAIRGIIGDEPYWNTVRVGYRRFGEDSYVPIWPSELATFNVK